jgi:hypothetical protein
MVKNSKDLLGARALKDPVFVDLNTKLETISGIVLPQNSPGSFSFDYNSSGNVTSISGENFSSVFTYDSSGNLSSVNTTYPSLNVLKTFDYNSSGEVSSITVSNI